jgi:hypothetical protein
MSGWYGLLLQLCCQRRGTWSLSEGRGRREREKREGECVRERGGGEKEETKGEERRDEEGKKHNIIIA